MIITKHYTAALSTRLPCKSVGNFAIEKVVMRKGVMLRTYDPRGFLYHDKPNKDFPVVKLVEVSKDGETLWMSDTPLEQEGLRMPVILARGDTLVIGLGIGLYPIMLRQKNRAVKTITIIEQHQEVVDLVYDHIKYRKTSVEVCDGEAYLAATDRDFDFIFIDVWGSLMAPIKQIDYWTKLARRCLKEDGEVRCWLQELYNRVKPLLPTSPVISPGPPAVYPPCLICGKKLRNDYAGLCMDCADELEVSECYHQ